MGLDPVITESHGMGFFLGTPVLAITAGQRALSFTEKKKERESGRRREGKTSCMYLYTYIHIYIFMYVAVQMLSHGLNQ